LSSGREKAGRLLPALELLLVAALVLVPLPLPDGLPIGPLIPLVLVASIALWARGQSWADVGLDGERIGAMLLAGMMIGVAAPLLEVAVASPALQAVTSRAPESSPFGMVRGSPGFLVTLLVIVSATAAAVEMVFRGYLLTRIEAVAGPHLGLTLGVSISALGSAWLDMDGDPGRLIGGLILGLGFAGLYLAGKRSLILPMVAHALYDVTHLVLVYGGVID
jgi:membrane protease YdiL (CAAX protease family)